MLAIHKVFERTRQLYWIWTRFDSRAKQAPSAYIENSAVVPQIVGFALIFFIKALNEQDAQKLILFHQFSNRKCFRAVYGDAGAMRIQQGTGMRGDVNAVEK